MLCLCALFVVLHKCKLAIDLFKSGLVRKQNSNIRFVTYLLKTYHEERLGSVFKVHVCSLVEQHACSSVSNDKFFSQDQTTAVFDSASCNGDSLCNLASLRDGRHIDWHNRLTQL
jgi:hypothetical protein